MPNKRPSVKNEKQYEGLKKYKRGRRHWNIKLVPPDPLLTRLQIVPSPLRAVCTFSQIRRGEPSRRTFQRDEPDFVRHANA